MKLRTLVRTHDSDGAWAYARGLINAQDIRRLHAELLLVVCTRYWRLTGELHDLLGDLGWGPGNDRDWDENQLYPPQRRGCYRLLKNFITDLCLLPPDTDLSHLVASVDRANARSIEATLLRFLITLTDRSFGQQIGYSLYDHIADHRTEYELGAARSYYWMLGSRHWKHGLAGLVLISTRGLDPDHVRQWRVDNLYARGGHVGTTSEGIAKRTEPRQSADIETGVRCDLGVGARVDHHVTAVHLG